MLRKILTLSTPVIFTYLAVGGAYGVLAENSGLTFVFTILMSIFVYAGTAQFLAVGLIASGVSPFVLGVSVFVVNLRYFLYSSILLKYIKTKSLLKKVFFSLEITDETFIVQTTAIKPGELDESSLFIMHWICHFSWVLGTAFGYFIGNNSFDLNKYGGEFALPIMFIALLAVSLKERFYWFLAILSIALVIVLNYLNFGQFSTILASVLAAFIGIGVKHYARRK